MRNFCPDCGARLYTSNQETFPATVFVQIGALDRPELIAPQVKMFTKRRLAWVTPLSLPQFEPCRTKGHLFALTASL